LHCRACERLPEPEERCGLHPTQVQCVLVVRSAVYSVLQV